jgi:hypothetical protein
MARADDPGPRHGREGPTGVAVVAKEDEMVRRGPPAAPIVGRRAGGELRSDAHRERDAPIVDGPSALSMESERDS